MKASNVLWYAIALIGPVVLFVWLLPLGNEKYPAAVFATCIGLMFLAGYMSSRGGGKNVWKWIAWSVVIGVLEAVLLVFAV